MGGGEGGGGAASVREHHDFANVASFSELPFLRSAPRRESASSGIRLFGIDVPRASTEGKSREAAAAPAVATRSSGGATAVAAIAGPDTSRKFECHYCCRHFPTSQALGGHQNAHKRERQHAKRLQMQSAMAAAATAAGGAHHHHHHLLGYPQHRFGMAGPTMATLYPSWPTVSAVDGGSGSSFAPQFYRGIGSVAQPINGNPLPGGLWRGPLAGHGSASTPLAGERRAVPSSVFTGDEPRAAASFEASPSSSSSSLVLSPQGQFAREQPVSTTGEGVSLDLHL